MTTQADATISEKPLLPRVWDIATRVWHWLIVAGVAAMWWTAENHMMTIHVTLGTLMAGALVFRITWGLWGSTTARFSHFVRGPAHLVRYMKKLFSGDYKPHFGHNPLGALSVIALIGMLGLQIGTGLFANNTDGDPSGPLNLFLSDYDLLEAITEFHELGFNILLALIALHLLAVAFYLFAKKINLVKPMVTGRMSKAPEDNEKAELKKPGPIWLIVSVALSAGIVFALFNNVALYKLMNG